MQRILISTILAIAFSLHAGAPPRGDARLRELVVFPAMDFTCNWGIQSRNNEWIVTSPNPDPASAIAEQREQLKRQPADVKALMELAYLLNSNDQTNEARACYAKAEQICRDKIAAQPHDGLSLTTLGAVLQGPNNQEAESVFRKATLVASNDWRCWVGLGNFLPGEYFYELFPTNLAKQVAPGQVQPPAVLDYRPAAEALKKAESACAEASRCFDRALALAPNEPEVFFQRAGYLAISNWQSCFFRHYRNSEEITKTEWLTSFFSQASAANLLKAGKLKPKDFELTSLAAYFGWVNVAFQNPEKKLDPNNLPNPPRDLIQEALARLENLSHDSDKKTAAGALENLGFLKVAFGNAAGAQADLRRAVALDPTREGAWDMLMGTLLDSASPDEMVSVCQARLKARDSARNHLIFSKVCAGLKGNLIEGARQAEIARKMETNNIVPPLMLAAIALKQSMNTNYFSVADTNLRLANELLPKMPEGGEKSKRWRELVLNTAILCALESNLEFAKKYVQAVLHYYPEDETAKDILKAIN